MAHGPANVSGHWLCVLIEMIGGHIPGIFAYSAGIGDIVVGAAALGVLLVCRHRERIHGVFIMFIIVIEMADFLSAFFFGFTSTQGPLQLFFRLWLIG